jgi:hypothetical protein
MNKKERRLKKRPKFYFYVCNQVTWNEAYSTCCKLGMELLSIDDTAELKCIFDLNNNDGESTFIFGAVPNSS